jgi:hypothetical protein
MRIAVPSWSVEATTRGVRAFGRTCPKMTRMAEAPSARVAATWSRSKDRERRASDQPGEGWGRHDGDGDDGVLDSVSENHDNGDPQEDPGKREKNVHQPHEHGVDDSSVVCREEPDERPHEESEADAREGDSERNPRAEKEPAPDVAAEVVGPEGVLEARTGVVVRKVLLERTVRRDGGSE